MVRYIYGIDWWDWWNYDKVEIVSYYSDNTEFSNDFNEIGDNVFFREQFDTFNYYPTFNLSNESIANFCRNFSEDPDNLDDWVDCNTFFPDSGWWSMSLALKNERWAVPEYVLSTTHIYCDYDNYDPNFPCIYANLLGENLVFNFPDSSDIDYDYWLITKIDLHTDSIYADPVLISSSEPLKVEYYPFESNINDDLAYIYQDGVKFNKYIRPMTVGYPKTLYYSCSGDCYMTMADAYILDYVNNYFDLCLAITSNYDVPVYLSTTSGSRLVYTCKADLPGEAWRDTIPNPIIYDNGDFTDPTGDFGRIVTDNAFDPRISIDSGSTCSIFQPFCDFWSWTIDLFDFQTAFGIISDRFEYDLIYFSSILDFGEYFDFSQIDFDDQELPEISVDFGSWGQTTVDPNTFTTYETLIMPTVRTIVTSVTAIGLLLYIYNTLMYSLGISSQIGKQSDSNGASFLKEEEAKAHATLKKGVDY